jgi:hypothetical protein
MKGLWGLAGIVLLCWPRSGLAADNCTPFMTELQPDCVELKRIREAAQKPDGTAEQKSALAAKDAELAKKGPFAAALCMTLQDEALPRTCNKLASALPSDGIAETVQKSPEAKAKEQEELASKVALAKQADRQASTNKAGAGAQVDPVESIQPITLAGAGITLSGTRSGTKGVGTITVNPLALTRPDSVAVGRMFDLSVSAPFDLDGGTSADQRYVSARLRVNATAPFSSAALQSAITEWLVSEGKYADDLEAVLLQTKDVKGCVASILKTNQVTVAACGVPLSSADVAAARERAFVKIKEARREADSYYLGIDARFDSGDPTGSDVIGDKGEHILGGIAAGVRIAQGPRFDFELRGRAAGDYFKSRDAAAGPDPKPVYSFDWGVALLFSGRVQEDDKQRLAFGAGVEGRHAGDSARAALAPTNYANLNLMAVVPALSGGDIGLAFSIPLADSAQARGVSINLSTDLGLLDRSGK